MTSHDSLLRRAATTEGLPDIVKIEEERTSPGSKARD